MGGVGKSSQVCTRACKHHLGLADGPIGSFEAPEIEDSDVPALLGLRGLDNNRSILVTFENKLIFMGPGGYQLKLSPGSRVYDLKRSNTGHLMLPCSLFKHHGKNIGKHVSFPVTPTEAPRDASTRGSPNDLQ